MRKFTLFLALLLLSVSVVFGQPTQSAISVNVVDSGDADELGPIIYPYKLIIDQEFYLDDSKYDTLRLELRNTSLFQTLKDSEEYFALIPNMAVSVGKNGDDCCSVEFKFDGVNIFIPTSGEKYVKLTYGYYSDFFARTDINIYAQLQFNDGWNSWYFTVNGAETELSKVSVTAPNTVDLIADCVTVATDDNTYDFQLDQMQNKTLSFYLIEKQWFECQTKKIDDVQVRLFLSKKEQPIVIYDENYEGDNPTPIELAQSYVQTRWEQVVKLISAMNRVFPDNSIKNITILEDDMPVQGRKYGYGLAVTQSDAEFAVFVDFSFWKDHVLAHELVHGYLKHNKYEKLDAKFFFDEALIEYFAHYAYYADTLERDEAFATRIEYFLSLPTQEHQPILDIERNYVKNDSGAGTWSIVYHKVPFLIHRLARKMGEDRFIEAVDAFYTNAKKTGYCLFEDFGKTMIEFGLSEKDWGKFKMSI